MNRDWHIHSNYSDSNRSIKEIVEIAIKNNLHSIAITDHDSVNNLDEINKTESGQLIIHPGIEISAWDPKIKKEVHILAYQFNIEATNIKAICESTIKQRNEIAYQQISLLHDLNFKITVEEVESKKGNSPCLYKQHILDVLKEKGYTDKIYGDFYKEMFKNGGPCEIKPQLPHIKEVIHSIHEDYGFAILAHPFLSKCETELERYKRYGIDGIETYHSSQTKENIETCNEIAKQFEWLETGGSDNHGNYGNEPEIGSYF
ncbi:MAG: PHP domain-containing protein [Anaerorhabdus sp.]|uniref:PHP domain-containing protein n=1 Tax=Anaerorhabdus sp. TaxID=1872524 RepID=UPI002B1ECD47|nr:PHP domain-containing protein [Anaerorhabdus sp.]MEA4875195.1 PHP domain-containing protein [Anaerorhabdus sp.]